MEIEQVLKEFQEVKEMAQCGQAALIMIVFGIVILTLYMLIDLSRENDKKAKRIKELEKEKKNGK